RRCNDIRTYVALLNVHRPSARSGDLEGQSNTGRGGRQLLRAVQCQASVCEWRHCVSRTRPDDVKAESLLNPQRVCKGVLQRRAVRKRARGGGAWITKVEYTRGELRRSDGIG